jgi:hypothetical protein
LVFGCCIDDVDATLEGALRFVGYGTAVQGATFTRVDAAHWSLNSSDGLVHEIITISNDAVIDPSDFLFV